MNEIEQLIRPDLLTLKPYSSARDEFQGQADIYIDANENPFESDVNRYPDPLQRELKRKISQIKHIEEERIFLGNGSDEILDLIFRLFCVPGKDEVMITPPTYGMYKVLAAVNNVFVKEIPLVENFQLDSNSIIKQYNRQTKILFLCSPNNPVGVSLEPEAVHHVLRDFPGIVVIDEAYIDFSTKVSFMKLLKEHTNLIVVQTLSKAWGMAGIRLGIAFTNSFIVKQLNKIKPPYNINILTQKVALKRLEETASFAAELHIILSEKKRVHRKLESMELVLKVQPSDANFLLVKFKNPRKQYERLLAEGIVVRDRSDQLNCEGCLRITIGKPEENDKLLEILGK